MTIRPPYADDWAGLAAVAERLRADRARDDAGYVQRQRLTQQQSDDRARVSEALAQQWRAIVGHEPIPWLDAGPIEIREDLEGAAKAAARRAAAEPKAVLQLGSLQVSYGAFAEAVAALLWQQQPYRDGTDTPRIVFIHTINMMARAERAARPAPPPPALLPAPPLRQSGLL
ncbi:MAG: hypothetical protein EON59_01380 [Alphaproteobacteria bacterium]|nr:MAG: hypothetical protein EON59_01380 [Alphaproteobacteria bacterium]